MALLLACLPLIAACPAPGGGGEVPDPDAGTPTRRLPDVVVDTNRDGRLDLAGTSDDTGEDTFSASAGAVVLANLDDDDDDGRADADTAGLDGDTDLVDLAPLAIRAGAGLVAGTRATFSAAAKTSSHARLFRFLGGEATLASGYAAVDLPLELTAAELERGVTFKVEARDVVTSTARSAFDGRLDFTLTVQDPDGTTIGEDTVRLRVAPVLFQFNTATTTAVYHSNGRDWSRLLVSGIQAMRGAAERVSIPQSMEDYDPWAQDFFDLASMVAPVPGGVHEMKVAIRSAQPDRDAGSYVERLLGPDVAMLEVSDTRFDPESHGYSMNSFGNWEVVPPYSTATDHYPLGRNLWGSVPLPGESPDAVFAEFVRAQGVQPELTLDTSWLAVGHVDEFHSFVPAPTPRGWALLFADPTRARRMLQDLSDDGHGRAVLFRDKWVFDLESEDFEPISAEATVDEILSDAERMAESQRAAAILDDLHATLVTELALAADETKSIPFLFEPVFGSAVAYQPGTVNLLVVDHRVLVPKPFGPVIGGVDPFEADLEGTFDALGIDVTFVDDWDLLHANMGEVHCGTNTSRTMNLPWWESSR